MKKLRLIFLAFLSACGSDGGGDTTPQPLTDAFVTEVQKVVATTSEEIEPIAIEAFVATAPEDPEPVAEN